MNIIKLKDKIKPKDEYFNMYLKGKYAFLIHCKYIVSFDFMTVELYCILERDIKNIEQFNYYDIDLVKDYVDLIETEKINSIYSLQKYNEYTTSSELTIEQIKNFRTWLATSLLNISEYEDNIKHMLEFYMNCMYDDTLKYLDEFGRLINITNVTHTGCSCCGGSSDLSSLYNTNLSACDCATVYKTGIHNLMVQTFSDVDFWSSKLNKFLTDFKLYIDNIIKLNLPLKSALVSDFVDCECSQGSNENLYNIMLKNLSEALWYIINNDMNGHKLFILDSLNKWADVLYESMQWGPCNKNIK